MKKDTDTDTDTEKNQIMNVLLSNDDGIRSDGVRILEKYFSKFAKTTIVAPEFEQSATGHGISLLEPLRVQQFSENSFAINGRPADCVNLALNGLLEMKPDFVLSGINQGPNLGEDVYYSGTVAAAREASILGMPAFAVSLMLPVGVKYTKKYNSTAARVTKVVVEQTFKKLGKGDIRAGIEAWPKGMVMNINVPNVKYLELKGISMAPQGWRLSGQQCVQRQDVRGKGYYWIGASKEQYKEIKGTDYDRVNRNYVSVTPLQLDCTDYKLLDDFSTTFPSP